MGTYDRSKFSELGRQFSATSHFRMKDGKILCRRWGISGVGGMGFIIQLLLSRTLVICICSYSAMYLPSFPLHIY